MVVIITIPIAVFSILREPVVQTFIARYTANYFSEKLKTEVYIGRFTFNFISDIILKDVIIKDKRDSTIINSKKIKLNLNNFDARNKTIDLQKIYLSDSRIEIIKYKNEDYFNFYYLIDHFNQNRDTIEQKKEPAKWDVIVDNLNLENCEFYLINENKPDKEKGIDFNDLAVSGIKMNLDDLIIDKTSDTIQFKMNYLGAKEKSGFQIKKLKANFTICPGELNAEHLELITNNSEIAMNLQFLLNSFKDFKDFIHKVEINTVIGNSTLNLCDIGFFAPVFCNVKNDIEISGVFNGTVNSFYAENFKFKYGKSTVLHANLLVDGLPEIKETFADLDIDKLMTNKTDLESFELPGEAGKLKLPQKISMPGNINVKGFFTGFYYDFIANANFSTDLGKLNTDIAMQQITATDTMKYKGHLIADNLNIGKILMAEENLKTLNMDADINGSIAPEGYASFNMNGWVDSLSFRDNIYNQIRIKGDFSEQKFSGSMDINDKKIQLDFNGLIDLSRKRPVFDFYAKIENADLYNLHLSDKDSTMTLSSVLNINFTGKDLDNMKGSIIIDSTTYKERDKVYHMDHLALLSVDDTIYKKRLDFKSDFIDASITGDFTFSHIIPSLKLFSDNYLKTFNLGKNYDKDTIKNQKINCEIKLKNTYPLSEIFLPELSVSPNSFIYGYYNSEYDSLMVRSVADSLIFQGMKFKDFQFESRSQPNKITLNTGTEKLVLKEATEKDTIELGIDNALISANIGQNRILYNIKWNDDEKENHNIGDIKGFVSMKDYPEIIAEITNADVIVNDTSWDISKDNFIQIDSSSVCFNNFSVFSNKQKLKLKGSISKQPQDTFNVSFNNWKISNFDLLYTSHAIDLDGIINGDLKLMDAYQSPIFISNLNVGDFYFNQEKMGDALILTKWNNENKSLHALFEVVNNENSNDNKIIEAGGYYYSEPVDSLDFYFELKNFKMKATAPFVKNVFEDIEGVASGRLDLTGRTTKPNLTGEIHWMRGGLKVDYLNVPYTFAQKVDFGVNSIDFNDMVLYDSVGNAATLNGQISHNHLKDFKLKLDIRPEGLACLNTKQYDNDIFYGEAFASGVVNISGPFKDIYLDVKATTNKGTEIFIPVSSVASVYEKDYIIFVNSGDTISSLPDKSLDPSGLSLDIVMHVTPDALIKLFLPMQLGNIIANGNGNLKFSIDQQGDFIINGDYVINEGAFLFTLRNIVTRKFEILKGSKISWTDDPYDAEINLRALYEVKTSLDGLGITIDTTSNYSQRVNVDCIIELKNKLFDPDIRFSIKFRNIDSQTEQLVYAVLDTNNVSQMNQQMISLLVLGSFSYRTPSFGASSAKLISNQLSNWLSQISQDFDIGVNYRPRDQLSQDELEVALSTQLFNDRVLIDGNVGVIGDYSSSSASNIVGDVNIEVKLTEDGRFRVKAFNRSNVHSVYDINTFDDRAPYTQGLGIFYRKEFNSFADLFGNKKKKDNKNK